MTDGKKVLVVEDDPPKCDRISAIATKVLPNAKIAVARSVRAAIASIQTSLPDLILLDMTLPMFDIIPGEPGGRPEETGGAEILRHIDHLGMHTDVIIVTGWADFVTEGRGLKLQELSEDLAREHPSLYRGAVHYDTMYERWENELTNLIKRIEGRNENSDSR